MDEAELQFWILVACSVVIYFAPTCVACDRKLHNPAAIAILNIFLCWSFLGWVAGLVIHCDTLPSRDVLGNLPA